MCAMIEKLRIRSMGRLRIRPGPGSRSARLVDRAPVLEQRHRVAGLALVPTAVADLEVQVVAPARTGAAAPAELLAGVDALALVDLGRLDHVHVDVGEVALLVVEIDVVALAAV